MKISNLKGKLVVVTGGSSGIGYSIAEQFAQRGADILLVARNQDKLNTTASNLRKTHNSRIETISAEITNQQDANKIGEFVSATWGCADIIISSAGIVSGGRVHDTPIEEWDRLHNTNVRGLVLVLQALIPAMIAANKKDGADRHIVNIASAAAYIGLTGLGAYAATKAAVVAIGESLRAELAVNNIGVSTIAPGNVRTPIIDTVQIFGSLNTPRALKAYQKMFNASKLFPEGVTKKVLQAVDKNRAFYAVGSEAVATYYLKRLSTRLLAKILSYLMKS